MAKTFNFENYAKNLPDSYRKDNDSNNYKILVIEKEAEKNLEADIEDVFNSLDIWQATGKTLDLYGEMYNIHRDNMTDDAYRLFILMRIVQTRAGSDHKSIVTALSSTLGIPLDVFYLTDSEISGNADITLPYDVFWDAGISPKQAFDVLKKLLGVGIGVGKFELLHEVPDVNLKIATAIVYGENFYVEILPLEREDVNTELIPSVAMMQLDYNEVEVK